MTSGIIEATGLNHAYGRQQALHNINLSFKAGKLTALLGPNGAGKTTLVKLMLGLLEPQAGEVRVAGGDPRRRATRRNVGAMLQISGVPETLTVGELNDLFASFYPDPLPGRQALQAARVADLAERRFGRLSGGQRQRVLLALALVGHPQILILDEPGNGLDPASRRALGETIRNQLDNGTTVVLCTHDLEEAARLADEVVILNHGEVIANGPPNGLSARVPTRRVRGRTNLSSSRLASLPGAGRVRNDDELFEVLVTDATVFLRALLEADKQVTDLEVLGASLEDAFLSLTGTTTDPIKENAA